jgi:hypothetical protein
MSLRTASPVEADAARGLAFVVLALRGVMSEICDSHGKFRVDVWKVFDAAAPIEDAKGLFGCFLGFARALLNVADRPLEWRQGYCAHLCRDEWLAATIIDAAQRADVAKVLGAAAELVGVEELGDVLNAAQFLACALSERGIYLRPAARCDLCPKRTLH